MTLVRTSPPSTDVLAVALEALKSLTKAKNGRACGVTSSGAGQDDRIFPDEVDAAIRANRSALAKQLLDSLTTTFSSRWSISQWPSGERSLILTINCTILNGNKLSASRRVSVSPSMRRGGGPCVPFGCSNQTCRKKEIDPYVRISAVAWFSRMIDMLSIWRKVCSCSCEDIIGLTSRYFQSKMRCEFSDRVTAPIGRSHPSFGRQLRQPMTSKLHTWNGTSGGGVRDARKNVSYLARIASIKHAP